LLVTVTELVSIGAPAAPPAGLKVSVGKVVSAGPDAGANGTLISPPDKIERTSMVSARFGSSPVRVAVVARRPTAGRLWAGFRRRWPERLQ